MTTSRIQYKNTAVDDAGNVLASTQVEVRRLADNVLASLYAAETGATAVTNPHNTDASGDFEFWIAPGAYTVTVGVGASAYSQAVYLNPAPGAYASRAALVADVAAGATWPDGTILSDGMLDYISDASASDISDLPGLLPYGDVHFEHFGAVAGLASNQSVAMQAAMDYCGATRQRLTGEGGLYYINQTLTMDKPFHLNLPFVADTTSSNPADSIANGIVWLGSGGANKMLVVKSATSGARLKYGRIDGFFDASNVASHCIHGSSWDNFTLGNVLTYRSTVAGTVLDDGNSALLNNPIIDRLMHFCGSNALAHAANGLVIDGDVTGLFATQAQVREYFGEYVNGDALTIRAIDNSTFGNIMPQERYGAGGTGKGIRIAKSVNFPSFQAQKNMFVHIGRGETYVEDGTVYNRCLFMNGEGTSVQFESAQGAAGRGTFQYSVGDRNSGAYYEDRRHYRLLDVIDLPVATASAVVGSPALSAFGGYGVRGLTFDPSATETAIFAPLTPQFDDGDVIGFELAAVQAGTASGNVRWQFELISRANAAAFGSAELTEAVTQAMNGTGSSMTKNTFYLSSPLSVTRGDMVSVRLSRLGADAADTYVNDVGVLTFKMIYKTDGPDAPGSGPYQVTDLEAS